MQPHACGDRADRKRVGRVAHAELIDRHELEDGPLAFGQRVERGVEGASLRRSVDLLLDSQDVVAFEQPSPLDAPHGAPLARTATQFRSDDVARDTEQPGARLAAVRPVASRRVDRREEYVSGQVGNEIWPIDTPRDEPLHRCHVLAVERLERRRVICDRPQLDRLHTFTWSLGPGRYILTRSACTPATTG